MIQLKKEDLINLKRINVNEESLNNNGEIYESDEKTLYKIIKNRYFFIDEIKRNTEFQISNRIVNTPQIFETIYINNEFYGYSMQKIKNSKTFREVLTSNIDIEKKQKAIFDIYESLKNIHTLNLTLGDIHLDNFLIDSNGNGYLIDLDFLRTKEEAFKFTESYLIKPNDNMNKLIISTPQTDNAKTLICSLSLLLSVDLEKLIDEKDHSLSLEAIYNNYIKQIGNSTLSEYFEGLMSGTDTRYFDDVLKKMFTSKNIKTK